MKKTAWRPEDTSLILRLMTGGAGLGAGAGLLTSLLKHVHTLNEERNPPEDEQALTVRLPNQLMPKKADSPSLGGLVAAGPAFLGGGLLSYHLARKLYEKYRRGEVQDDMVDADEAFQTALAQEAAQSKVAMLNPKGGLPMNPGDTITSLLAAGAVGIPFLSSAVLAHTLLEGRYPKDEPTSPIKNIVLRPPKPSQEDEDDLAAAMPLASQVALSHKTASYLPGMIKAAGDGRLPEMEQAVMTSGWDGGAAMERFKTASAVSTLRAIAGTVMLHKSALLSPGFGVILGAELADMMSPTIVKIAGALPDSLKRKLIKWAALHTKVRFCAALSKVAGDVSPNDGDAAQARLQDHLDSNDPNEATLLNLASNAAQSDDSTGSQFMGRLNIPPVDDVDTLFSQNAPLQEAA